jgi:nucleotide-binding universal stress UspA family protein
LVAIETLYLARRCLTGFGAIESRCVEMMLLRASARHAVRRPGSSRLLAGSRDARIAHRPAAPASLAAARAPWWAVRRFGERGAPAANGTSLANLCIRRLAMSDFAAVQIVVAFDFSPRAEHALARAIDVVARAPQHVMHVAAVLDAHGPLVTTLGGTSYRDAEHLQQVVSERVAAAFAGRPTAAEVRFFVHARIGKPHEEVLELAREVGADLIFIGSHGKTGLERILLGSVSEKVVREARCPVMVVRAKGYPTVERTKVMRYDHPRAHHAQPHLYSYSDKRVTLRPLDWPIS